jgi:hypothetical protein
MVAQSERDESEGAEDGDPRHDRGGEHAGDGGACQGAVAVDGVASLAGEVAGDEGGAGDERDEAAGGEERSGRCARKGHEGGEEDELCERNRRRDCVPDAAARLATADVRGAPRVFAS